MIPATNQFIRNGIDCVVTDNKVVIRLSGDIDASLRDEASRAMALVATERKPVVVNSSQLGFIDSTGVAFLVQMHAMCKESDISLTLIKPTKELEYLLEIVGVKSEFDISWE